MKNNHKMKLVAVLAFVMTAFGASAQKYQNGVIDKTIAVVGNEMVTISQLEEEVQMMMAYGMFSDKTGRCELLEQMMSSKLFLMQARVDSIAVNNDMVETELRSRMDNVRTQLGGDEGVEEYFKKPLHKLRQEWREAITDQTLTQQMQQEIAKKVQELTPYDVQEYVESVDQADLPVVPVKYQLRQICIYPDREAVL